MSTILGLNAFHADSSACIIKNGQMIAAVEEERFRRVKHWAGFPSESIRYCLEVAGITLADVDHIAINQDSKANIWKKLGFTLLQRPDMKLVLDRIKNKRERSSLATHFADAFPDDTLNAKIYGIEHHMAHLASAFYVSPYQDAVTISIDGFGDFASAAWGIGKDTKITVDDRVYFPHSMGMFYQALTQYIGFPNYGDEYKVMGLAPYGKPIYLDEMRQIVLLQDDGSFRLNMDYFVYHREKVDYEWDNGTPVVGRLFDETAMVKLLGDIRQKDDPLEQKHKDIARSVQAMFEETFFHLLKVLHQRHNTDALCLSGGCAMNSVANGKVTRNTPFKKVYIQSAAGDAGGAIGAAYAVWHQTLKQPRSFVMDHAYWGPEYHHEAIVALLTKEKEALASEQCVVEHITDVSVLCQRTAQAIADGKVIGWFQGRLEWGPRALGNRSILGDPRRADMKDILNLKIKRRESFRPFAPSILRDSVSDWFEQDDEVPFMMKVFQIKEERRSQIPAVAHADGSGRLQTVYADSNPRYHALITAFNDLTHVPILLNTSFNENEPVVCQPKEALACFLRTKMDVLVLGDMLIERRS